MRRLLLSFILLLCATLLGGGWYAYDKGFTRKWRGYVTTEFRKRGVEVVVGKLMLDPVRGIVARNVRVHDARERRRTLAVVDEMRLVINWANLVQGKTFLDALDLKDANLSLPLDPAKPQGAKVEITRLSGRLFLPPQQVYLSSLEANLYGIQLTASGRVINPQNLPPMREEAEPGAAVEIAARVIEELQRLTYSGPPPQLHVQFSGDLTTPENLYVELTLSAQSVSWKKMRVETLDLAADYRDGRIQLKQLVMSDAAGTLHLTGDYGLSEKSAVVQLRSTLNPEPLLRSVDAEEVLQEIRVHGQPKVALTARANFADDPQFHVTANIAAQRFSFRGVDFESFAADASWDGSRWSARDVRVVHHTGEITGDILHTPEDVRTRLRSTINPKILRPLLPDKAAEWFSQFDFADPAEIEAEARGASFDLQEISAHGALKLGRSSYRGVPAESCEAQVIYADRRLLLEPLHVRRTEGTGTGTLSFDFARDEVRIENVRTTLHAAEVVRWIDPKLVKDLLPYRFGALPPQLTINGLVHTKGGATKLFIDLEAPGGMEYTFLKRELHFPQLSAKLAFANNRLTIDRFSASIFGGHLRGEADISLLREQPGHRVQLRLENIDFQSLTRLYFDFGAAKGRLNAHFNFTGAGDDARVMRGRGALDVSDGDVFAIPFLGPLSGILNSIVPGMGSDVARKGSASFEVSNGVIRTSDFLVEGNGFSMIGGGNLMFLDDAMDFSVRINARGLPGVLLFPVSKLFEYVADDRLSRPRWRPKALPKL